MASSCALFYEDRKITTWGMRIRRKASLLSLNCLWEGIRVKAGTLNGSRG